MRNNIIISATRQWNPGDEFIMQGALNVLKYTFGDQFNPIIFNRNPDIRGGSRWRNATRNTKFTFFWDQKNFKGKGILQELFRIGHFDNSFKDDMELSDISFVLFAGSPEWYGNRLIPLYSAIEKNNLPTIFFGLGSGDSSSFEKAIPEVKRVLSKSLFISTRDHSTEELLKDYGARYIPCPAFLSADRNHLVKNISKIGLIYATDRTVKGNNVSRQMHEYILQLYPEIMKYYEVGIVCHYIDELEQARSEFPNADIYYSYDAKDYADIYDNFDFVVGGRVHGIGMSASLGIPGLMIKHDARSDTTDGFLADFVYSSTSVDETMEKLKKNLDQVESQSARLLHHKKEVMEQYASLLKSCKLPLK